MGRLVCIFPFVQAIKLGGGLPSVLRIGGVDEALLMATRNTRTGDLLISRPDDRNYMISCEFTG